ncbi:uncharacterized protein LOC131675514 [Phymastichus coffea]|uniref:uncharacterized protein LOC131675514 n=1 Tax=Phymastichus coffea TaxID=108790 RepID=UPI00273C712B|nr:uncharacterized protein LOC131675514 [Phymastichus coffea]
MANEVKDEKKVPLLITFLGNKGYALLRELCTPDKPASKNYAALTETLKNHLKPESSEISERYAFKKCRQKEGEDIKTFVANLKKLSVNCNFGTELKTHLRDQFVFGVSCKSTKRQLLKEKALTFDSAVLLAQSTETATRDAEGMLGESTAAAYSTTVNYVTDKKNKNAYQSDKASASDQQSYSSGSGNRCYCCGKANHRKATCRYRDYKCNNCQEVGHLAIVCKVAKSQSGLNSRSASNFRLNSQANYDNERTNNQGYSNNRNGNRANNLNRTNLKQNYIDEVDSVVEEFDNLYHLVKFENKMKVKPLKINLVVENVTNTFEIDTGSPITAMSSSYFFSRQ